MENNTSNSTYEADVFCKNCDFEDKIEIEEGVEVKNHPCPKCKTRNLERKHKPARMIPKITNYR